MFDITMPTAAEAVLLPRAMVTRNVDGWPVGFVGLFDERHRCIWNATFTDYWFHRLGDNCGLTDEPLTVETKGL
jgi:hypothetical protein